MRVASLTVALLLAGIATPTYATAVEGNLNMYRRSTAYDWSTRFIGQPTSGLSDVACAPKGNSGNDDCVYLTKGGKPRTNGLSDGFQSVANGTYTTIDYAYAVNVGGYDIPTAALIDGNGSLSFYAIDPGTGVDGRVNSKWARIADGYKPIGDIAWRNVTLSNAPDEGQSLNVMATDMNGRLHWFRLHESRRGNTYDKASYTWEDRTSDSGFAAVADGRWAKADSYFIDYNAGGSSTDLGGTVWGLDYSGRLRILRLKNGTWSSIPDSTLTAVSKLSFVDVSVLSFQTSNANFQSIGLLVDSTGRLHQIDLGGDGVWDHTEYAESNCGVSSMPARCEAFTGTFKHAAWNVAIMATTTTPNNAPLTITGITGTPSPLVSTRTLTFDSNGGTTVAAQTVSDGAKPSKPADPTRSGFTFAGWYTDNDSFNDPFDFSKPLAADVTVYAKWTSDTVAAACVPVTGAPISDWIWPTTGFAIGLAGLAVGLMLRRRRA